MTKNQSWFERNFTNKKEEEIIIKYEDFEGQLLIENYLHLEKLYLRRIDSIEKIILKNLIQLKELTIWDCGIKDLIIKDCLQIKKINVRDNFLTSLEFLQFLNNKSGEIDLDISFNNFSGDEINSSLELEIFGNINLSNLNIGNSWRGKSLWNIYNRFSGSLMYLKNNKKLKGLDISNTDIDKGLEHLPESLEGIRCSNDFWVYCSKRNKCSQIVQELKDYQISGNYYDLCSWRNERFVRENNNRINGELKTELNITLEFNISEKKEQWNSLLTSLENQITNETIKEIIQELKDSCQLGETMLKFLKKEISPELMERLRTIQEELKELENRQEWISEIQVESK